MSKTSCLIATAAAGLIAGTLFFATSPDAVAQQQASPAADPTANMGQQLMDGLNSTPGCLGVQTGDTHAGHSFIMAWFENAEAARAWYLHPTHQAMVNMAGGVQKHAPLEHVTDENAPVMVIASITFAEKPEIPNIPIPISQIAIEMYTPLPGGAMVNGRLAPEGINVPHMKDYTDKPDQQYGS